MFDFLLEIVKLPWAGAAVMLRIVGITAVLFGTDYKFTEPAFKMADDNLYLVSRIEGGYNKKIRELLLGATPVVIEYSLTMNNRKTVFTKELSYDLFSKTFTIFTSDGYHKNNLKLAEAAAQVENVLLPICTRSNLPAGRVKLELSARAKTGGNNPGSASAELWSDPPGLKIEFTPQLLKP